MAIIATIVVSLFGLLTSFDSLLGATLKVDFNQDNTSSPTWESFNENDRDLGRTWSKRFSNGIAIEILSVGGVSLDTRDRALSNGGGNEVSMWRDFLFANGSLNRNQGLDIRITGLAANATYPVRIWSFDSGSRTSRLSTWSGTDYSFDGNARPPQSLAQNLITLDMVADGNGTAIIQARTGTPPGPAHNVFINGLEIGELTQLPDTPFQIMLSSTIAYQSNPIGTQLGSFSMQGSEPDETFFYELTNDGENNDNEYFEIIDDQLLTAKLLNDIPTGSILSLRVRSTDGDLNSVVNELKIRVVSEGEGVAPIRINEFMADNQGIHLDGDDNAVDWIEIHNPRNESINLKGFSLTDDPNLPGKWVFPSITLQAGGYLVIYGGAPVINGVVQDNYRDAKGHYHFNFNLRASGEFLAIVRPDGRTYEFAIEPAYPAQYVNVSYGLNRLGEWNFFENPSPGQTNGNGYKGIISDTQFSVNRGFYDTPFEVIISTEEIGTNIQYTLDGSQPTLRNGQTYLEPIPITGTTTLRAFAFREDWKPTNVDTHTYIFIDDVAKQPANPPGWPENWGTNGEVNNNDGSRNGTVPADYEMDPRVVENTLPGYGIRDALLDIPSVSIVMEQDDFIKPGSGIYAIPQTRIEKPCSIEYLLPDGSNGFQDNCKIEVHGNSSRRPWRMQKHSLRVTFTSEQGAARLDYPLFSDSPVSTFNKLILRACFTDSWGLVSWEAQDTGPMTRNTSAMSG